MKLLLDHCVDCRFAALLPRHSVHTAAEMNWHELKNGKLLIAAAAGGFDAIVTTDRNFKYQQNLARLPIAVVVLKAVTNRVSDLAKLAPPLENALPTLAPCTLLEIGAD